MTDAHQPEIIMLPLTEVSSIRWTDERRERLRELRKDMKLSDLARELANKGVSVSRQYLYRMESDPNVRGATPELLVALSNVLGVSLSELLCLNSQNIVQLGVDTRN
jgi:transcriptional regulator with XRE-family HTH domain